MNEKPTVITDIVREDVRRRAAQSSSLHQIGDAIFHALVAADADWRHVELDDVKRLLVDATRAFNHSRRVHHGRVNRDSQSTLDTDHFRPMSV